MALIESLRHTSGQLLYFLGAVDSDHYTKPLELFSGASVGQHVRHIVEYFELLAAGADQGAVCYDDRERDISLECDPEVASERLQQAIEELYQADLYAPLELSADYSNTGADRNPVTTTVEREMMYTLEHAIHHMAIIKMGVIQEFPEIELPDNFGIAYSTIRFRSMS